MDSITEIVNIIGVVYIAIPIVFLVIGFFYYLAGKRISKESFDKIVDIAKWYIVSVAIVFSAKIIESSFSERETGIKEMQVYDKYVETILQADNIEARWKLAEYFSTVTPTDRLRDRWIEYKDLIEQDYRKFVDLKQKEAELFAKAELTSEEKLKLTSVQQNLAPFEKRLVSDEIGRYVVVLSTDKNLEQAEFELKKYSDAGVEDVKIYLQRNNYFTVSKEFGTRQDAKEYQNTRIRQLRNDSYIFNLDKWCQNEVFNGRYYECK